MSKDNRPKDYLVLLYYRFTPVPDPQAERDAQFKLCQSLNLKGRILVATEGINGTCSGLRADAEAYMEAMKAHPLFKGIEFKIDEHHEHTFNKLHVRVKPELVHMGVMNAPKVWEKSAPYIEPEEMRQLLRDKPEDVVIVDARSVYESNLGKFKNAITIDIDNFRDLPKRLDELKDLKDKKIVTYCTGGIKCEKLSGLMMEHGFENIYQLHGGIVRYGKEAGGEGFEGQCYVFDQRVTVPVNEVDPVVIGKCKVCGNPTERMINCANAACNVHELVCDDCLERLEGCCSEACLESPLRRRFDGTGQYLRGVNSKNYVKV